MTLSLHSVVMSSQITHRQLFNTHPLSHILGTCSLISAVAPFLKFVATASCNCIQPLQTKSQQSRGGRSETAQEPSKNGHEILNHLHMHQGSELLAIFPAPFSICCRNPLSHYTQSNLSLPHTRPPLSFEINSLLEIQYSSILSMCPNHLNTL